MNGFTKVNRVRLTHSILSLASQWNDFMKSRKPNMKAKGASNSSLKIVNASRDSVTKNQSLSYKR